MRPLKVGGNCAYVSIRIVLNVVRNRFSVFISYRPCAGWQLFDLVCQSANQVCGIVLTANQHCGQSLTIETTNL